MISLPGPGMRSRPRLAQDVLPGLLALAHRRRPAKPVCRRRVSVTTVTQKRPTVPPLEEVPSELPVALPDTA